MFTTEYAYEKLKELDYDISMFLSKKYIDVHQKEYIEHLKRRRMAYEAELKKAQKRKPDDEIEALDYIRRYFPTDRSFV